MSYNSLLLAATPRQKSYYASKNFGVHRVAAEFRSRDVDTQVVHYFNRFTDTELKDLVNKYCNANTVVVGFNTMFWENYEDGEKEYVLEKAKTVATYVKTNLPHVKVIVGGPSCRLFLKDEFENLIDAIFEGFSENDFIKYIEHLKGNGLCPIPNKSYNSIDVYNNIYGSFDFSTSTTLYTKKDCLHSTDVPTLEVGRGCIFKCKFCAFALNGKKKFDYIKDPDILRQELIHNYENFGFTNYILSDDTFNDSTYKIEMLHRVFTSLPFDIKFASYLRLDLLRAHPEQIPLLKEMGLVGAFFGIESFNYESAKLIGKGLDPDIAKEMLLDLKANRWGNKVKIGVGLIVGLPYEDYKSHERTQEWILDENNTVDQVIPFPLGVTNPNNVKPQPWDSEFQKNADTYGFYWPNNDSIRWHNRIGPIKSLDEAERIYADYSVNVSKSARWKQGGFNLLKAYPLISSQKDAPSLDQLLEMNRYQYTKYIKHVENNTDLETKYVEDYKKEILYVNQTRE